MEKRHGGARPNAGAKPIAGVAAEAFVTVRLTSADAARLKEIARRNQQSRAAFIRDAIEAAIAECGERSLRAGA